jgi:hypothetical protein
MSDFKEYFFSKKSESSDLASSTQEAMKSPSIQKSIATISGSIVGSLSAINAVAVQSFSESEKEKFANEASSLAHSEDFIQEFSSIIEAPKKEETEDEFVKRAKNAMRKLLSEKLG